MSLLRIVLTRTLIFLLLGLWYWHLYQFSLFYSLYISFLASELKVLSQKQASLPHHKWRIQQSLWRCAFLYFSFVVTPGPHQPIEMYSLNLWNSDSFIQTFLFTICASVTLNHVPNFFGLTFFVKKKKINIYFIWLHWVLVVACRISAASCRILCCGIQRVVAHGNSSCGLWAQ